jgi:predicted anti-sigma-YlaC factor YlaD
MNVTKDVVIDLLPAYLSGEASADTRALIEEIAAREPAVARLIESARRDEREPMLKQPLVLPPDIERKTVSRTRAVLRGRSWALSLAIMCTLLPFTFEFPADHLTMWFVRDQRSGFLWVLAATFWLTYVLLGRRLRAGNK